MNSLPEATTAGRVAPWAPGAANVLLANMPALDDVSKLTCLWGGMISVAVPGQMTEDIP